MNCLTQLDGNGSGVAMATGLVITVGRVGNVLAAAVLLLSEATGTGASELAAVTNLSEQMRPGGLSCCGVCRDQWISSLRVAINTVQVSS